MSLLQVVQFVTQYAPKIGSVLSGANPVVGVIMHLLEYTFNAISDDPKDVLDSMLRDQNVAVKLKELELKHIEFLVQQQTEDKRISTDDRMNARGREEEIIRLTGHRDWVLNSLAILVVVGFFALCFLNYFVDLSEDRMLVLLIGQISSGFMLVLGYFFGASAQK